MSEPARGDWPEDFSGENGNYECHCITCKGVFFGYKRRLLCKVCHDLAPFAGELYVVCTEFDRGPKQREESATPEYAAWCKENGIELVMGAICQETYLTSQHASLEAARERVKSIGDRYGKARIAKLVFIEDTP